MKNLNKLFAISVIFSCFIFNLALADDEKSDCRIFGKLSYSQGGGDNGFNIVNQIWETNASDYSKFLTIGQQKKIITNNDLNTAILNLKKYCCENGLGGLSGNLETCIKDKTFFNPNALDSQYLYDHIFDVMMRRLNGLTGDKDIYTNTKMTVDDKGQEWRMWIDSKAEDLSGSDSQSIIDGYLNMRTQSKPELGYDITSKIIGTKKGEKFEGGIIGKDDQKFLSYVSGGEGEDSKKVSNALKNYDKWTLYDRYSNLCAVSAYLYILLENQSNSEGKRAMIDILHDGICYKVVQNQIDGENKYVQLVTQRASNLFLSHYVEGYISYLYDRGNKLKTLRKNTTDRFLDVARAVPQLTRESVK